MKTKAKGKKFSIIVPIYNVEDCLIRCIESIINQSYKELEIILVNDGSTDGSPNICDEYEKKENRIKVIHKENKGLSDARNCGLKEAKGEYIVFVDSDDYIEPDACEKFNEIIKKQKDVDIIASNIRSKNKGKKRVDMNTKVKGEENFINGQKFLKEQLRNDTMHISANRNVYRRQFLIEEEIFFKFGVLHEDLEWTPRVFLNAKKVISTKIVHYIKVERKGSISQKEDMTKNAIDIMKIVEKLSIEFKDIKDEELRLLLYDYLVMLYLSAFFLGKMYKKNFKNFIKKDFLRKNALSKKNKIKVKIFCFNNKIYYLLNKLSKTLPIRGIKKS